MPRRRALPAGASRPLPSRNELLSFIAESPGPVGRREIARAFRVRGTDRAALNDMVREIERDGAAGRRRGRRPSPGSGLPEVTVLEVIGVDADGEPLARPLDWRGDGAPPRIVMLPEPRGRPGLAIGDRVLARLRRSAPGGYEGRTIKRLAVRRGPLLGVYRRGAGEGRVTPTERRSRTEFVVADVDALGAEPGELVLAEALPGRRLGLPRAKVVERLGASLSEPRAISQIAILSHGIPVEFPPAALEEAAAARPVTALDKRDDLRALPLVTIDGADARDFDDAVWAEPDPDAPGCWHAVVAIADVAHYVRPGDALDGASRERGNSVYFPDRVVPMLPEALSNELCSLKPGEDRPCLAAHLWIDGDGALRRHRFVRGLMRSAARLTYEEVQAAHDGPPGGPPGGPAVAPLYGVYRALARARLGRGAVDLDMPEHTVALDDDGRVTAIGRRRRLDSHRLIEELMIAANVAAAEALEAVRAPVMYRVHDEPAAEKVAELRGFLDVLGHKLAGGRRVRPGHFAALLRQIEDLPHAPAVNLAVLRCQARAMYGPHNVGHFGLGLSRYCHFTSPIRRYADLLVHRALIGALGLGEGGLAEGAEDAFDEIGEHVSQAERRAVAAERDALDRFAAAYLAAKVGATFAGRISGVTRFGLFVTLDETGADGIVPRRSLPGDFVHDEKGQRLIGDDYELRLGDAVEVRLKEAEVATGSLVFELIPDSSRPPRAGRGGGPARGRGKRRRR